MNNFYIFPTKIRVAKLQIFYELENKNENWSGKNGIRNLWCGFFIIDNQMIVNYLLKKAKKNFFRKYILHIFAS